ncbi:hypothetical protein EHV86_005156, partial [Escherichia coli]|nr:hypothetical protein [Escherichia coli]EJO9114602.1 hypothetical protein [Escherichia coli]
NDHDGNYILALEFLLDQLKDGVSFKIAKERAFKESKDCLENTIRQMLELEEEKYSESEIKFAIEEAQNDFSFLWVFDEMTSIYDQYGFSGLYELFFIKYKAMKNERLERKENDEDY